MWTVTIPTSILNSVIKTKPIDALYIYLQEFASFFAVAFSLEKKKGF